MAPMQPEEPEQPAAVENADGKINIEQIKAECEKEADQAKEEQKRQQEEEDETVTCRFCWDATNTEENPLFQCCSCSGGVKFIHLSCLRFWIDTKMTKYENPRIRTY